VESAGADRIIEDVDLTVARDCLAKRAVSSAFLANRYSGWSASLFRKNLDHAGQRPRSIDRTLRAARDFNSPDVVRREVGKIKLTGESLIDRNAIEQDLHVLARQTAQENRGQLTGSSSLNDGKSRNFTQRVGHPLDLFMID